MPNDRVRRVPVSEPEFERAVDHIDRQGRVIEQVIAAGDGAVILVVSPRERRVPPGEKEARIAVDASNAEAALAAVDRAAKETRS